MCKNNMISVLVHMAPWQINKSGSTGKNHAICTITNVS